VSDVGRASRRAAEHPAAAGYEAGNGAAREACTLLCCAVLLPFVGRAEWRLSYEMHTTIQFVQHTATDGVLRDVMHGICQETGIFVLSIRLSVLPFAWKNTAPIGWIFMEFHILVFFENLLSKFQFH